MIGCSGVNTRTDINYFSSTPDSKIDIYSLTSTILDLIEGKYETTYDYMRDRIIYSIESLGLDQKIQNTRHIEYPSLISDLLDGDIQLVTMPLPLFKGVFEFDPKYADLNAHYLTGNKLKGEITKVNLLLSSINFEFLINYFQSVDPNIADKSITLSDLMNLGLPNPAPIDDGDF
jgi:hypothetical protein